MRSLVIVESPAKARTIEKYLGKDYEVMASMGHLRDLPKSKLGVDIERDFEPVYEPIKGKEDLIKSLKRAVKKADMIYLATDPDREGEAISWHLKTLLELPDEKARRVTFNEITKRVVRASIDAPREIDQDLVDAQQARRILDRLVGYKLSPLLWKKIRRGLSAGRVQSVATRMVDDREQEIENFKPEEYWSLDAWLESDKKKFLSHWHGTDGKKGELHSQEEVERIVQEITHEKFIIEKIKRGEKKHNPSPPFTTSTLQQEASRKLNMTPKRTMMIAQQLYEGVEISGEGAVGLITYMRTDSLRLSEEAIQAARSFIENRYGNIYRPEQPRRYKAKSNAQDAHEAIRPSDVFRTPEQVKKDLTREQYNLYKLIWSRFLACQMSSAVFDAVSVEIRAGRHDFRASASSLKFAGFTAVYEESKDESKARGKAQNQAQDQAQSDEEEEPYESGAALPPLEEGQIVDLSQTLPEQHFTQPPARYTDASLIRAMEEQGIGRPSTYAPTVSTILDRQYVIKEGKNLRITNLGRVVTQLMKERFSDIADLKFTARMENELDEIEAGKADWKGVLRNFYAGFDHDLQSAEQALEGVRIKVPDEVTDEICPECGRNLVIKRGPFGPFLACPGYPECEFTMPLVEVMPGRCPKCGGRLLKRTGVSQNTKKQYIYYCCENQVATKHHEPTCDFRTWDTPLKDDCPICGRTLFKRSGRGSRKPFCINPDCPNFVPEDQRGYKKKSTDDENANTDENIKNINISESKDAKAKKTTKKASGATAKKSTSKTTKKASDATAKKSAGKTSKTTKKTVKKAKDESGED